MSIVNTSSYERLLPLGNGQYALEISKTGKRQVPFIDDAIPLPYTFHRYHLHGVVKKGSVTVGATSQVWGMENAFPESSANSVGTLSPDGKLAYNRAYGKLRTRLAGDSADLLTLIREYRQLTDMIYRRVHQTAMLLDEVYNYSTAMGKKSQRAAKYRQKTLRRIGTILATPPQEVKMRTPSLQKRQGVVTTPAQLILELRWGWGPLVSDITNGLLGAPKEPRIKYSASAGYPVVIDHEQRTYDYWPMHCRHKAESQFRVKVGCELVIGNPLVTELERIGLSNFAQSLYETTPYSWLIDYFSSLGDVISSWDDFLTGSTRNVYVTFFSKGEESVKYTQSVGTPSERRIEFRRQRVHMYRTVPSSVPLPRLTVHWADMSPWRLATMASLVALKARRFVPETLKTIF